MGSLTLSMPAIWMGIYGDLTSGKLIRAVDLCQVVHCQRSNGKEQPITAAPQVAIHPKRNADTVPGTELDELTYIVLFGTLEDIWASLTYSITCHTHLINRPSMECVG